MRAIGAGQRQGVISQAVLKRVLDVVGATIALVVLSPLMAVAAIAIKLDSRGPVLFNQDRQGARRVRRNGSPEWERVVFRVHKFRTMTTGADETSHQRYIEEFVAGTATAATASRSKFKMVGDPRVTRVGKVLRRTSIDELPQLLNVLAGEMSLVGPRPVPLYEVAQYEHWQLERLDALPGMTGYWQVHGRGRVNFNEMMQMDIFYVRNQSLKLDLSLLMKTIPAVISGKGAE